jgi:hypothetical protein
LLVLAFFLGLFTGVGLLRYNGSEPVNLIYYLAAVFVLPLMTMTLSLLAMLRAGSTGALLVHLSPAYWMENILLMLPGKRKAFFEKITLNPLLLNWIVIRRSQELALVFSLGLFLALLWVVSSEDIAFAWSTTLQVSADEFHRLLRAIALPWREWLPQAVPSIELIERSHYFRLGGAVSDQMVTYASKMGEWWKFLAMTTLVYAILLRLFFFLGASWGLRRALERSILSLEGVRELLREMREPLITTQSLEEEASLESSDANKVVLSEAVQRYDMVIGWALDEAAISLQNDTFGIDTPRIREAGGSHSLAEDRQVIEEAKGDILLYVKAWEPPTNDFADFLADLSDKKGVSVTIRPLGTPEEGGIARDEDFAIWARRIAKLKKESIRMVR